MCLAGGISLHVRVPAERAMEIAASAGAGQLGAAPCYAAASSPACRKRYTSPEYKLARGSCSSSVVVFGDGKYYFGQAAAYFAVGGIAVVLLQSCAVLSQQHGSFVAR